MTRTNATVEKTAQALDSMAPVLRDLPMVAVMKISKIEVGISDAI
jgi:hypothetical protein